MLALSVQSLGGNCHRIEAVAHVKLAEVKARLEEHLPPFSEVRLFQGDRELLDDGSTLEVELQAVVVPVPSRALTVLESYLAVSYAEAAASRAKANLPSGYAEAFSAAVVLGEMQELDVNRSKRLFDLLVGFHRLMWQSSYKIRDDACKVELLVSTLSAAFGRCCGDPAPFIPRLMQAVREKAKWAFGAVAEIALRSEDHLNAHSTKILQSARVLVEWQFSSSRLSRMLGSGSPHGLALGCDVLRVLGQFGNQLHENVLEGAAHRIEEARVQPCACCVAEGLEKVLGAANTALELIRARELEASRHTEEAEIMSPGRDDNLSATNGNGAQVAAASSSSVADGESEQVLEEAEAIQEEQAQLQEALLRRMMLRESEAEAIQDEQAQLQEALLRCMIISF